LICVPEIKRIKVIIILNEYLGTSTIACAPKFCCGTCTIKHLGKNVHWNRQMKFWNQNLNLKRFINTPKWRWKSRKCTRSQRPVSLLSRVCAFQLGFVSLVYQARNRAFYKGFVSLVYQAKPAFFLQRVCFISFTKLNMHVFYKGFVSFFYQAKQVFFLQRVCFISLPS